MGRVNKLTEVVDCGFNGCNDEMLESQCSRITFDHFVVFLCEKHYPIMLKYNEKMLQALRDAPKY